MKTNIKSLSLQEIKDLLKELGQPSFRAQQLIEWLYARNATSYDDMTNLPNALRETLSLSYPLRQPKIIDKQVSKDETQKFILSYHDGVCVETVAIPSESGRLTVCCSSQAGCAMGCGFCATGKAGFTRNLSVGEITDQIFIAQETTGKRVSNIVVMGQGEPFLNYDNTLEALRILNNVKLLNIGARHITLSTCGIIPGIEKFAEEPEQFTLAVSLHTAVQKTRDNLMPGVSSFSLGKLRQSLLKYTKQTNRRVTIEYALINGVNDSIEDLSALQSFCKDMLCHINIIPLNRIEESHYQPSASHILKSWHITLNKNGIETTIRHSKGSDIAGACGQLKMQLKNK